MLTQNHIDGTEKSGVIPVGKKPKFLNIRLSKFALQRNNLIPRTSERMNYRHLESVVVARKFCESGYDVEGTRYVSSSKIVAKPKPTFFQKAMHKLQLVEIFYF